MAKRRKAGTGAARRETVKVCAARYHRIPCFKRTVCRRPAGTRRGGQFATKSTCR